MPVTMARERFGPVSLRDSVRDLLLERVLAGEYPPGARLVETRIARELGISQAPLREALRDLEQLGLVTTSRSAAARSARCRSRTCSRPTRCGRRSRRSRRGSRRRDRRRAARGARGAHRRDARCGGARRPRAESAADAGFHAEIVAAAGNPVLARQWELLQPHARTFISMALPDAGPVAERHVPILAALRAHDADRAATAMHDHLTEVVVAGGRS